jgi:hypothetical protein
MSPKGTLRALAMFFASSGLAVPQKTFKPFGPAALGLMTTPSENYEFLMLNFKLRELSTDYPLKVPHNLTFKIKN